MATPSVRPVSNIAVAFATQSASSNLAPHGHGHGASRAGVLPTPPNSLSPALQPRKNGRDLPASRMRLQTPGEGDMEIDLQDAIEHAAAQDQPAALSKEALAGLDASRQITAVMLAKHHLPGIILGHGAMPIREMMAHLAQSVPGFARLAPSKARRLMVAALEHRAGGGLHGEVKFEKVGWGRWSVAGSQNGSGMPIGSLDGAGRRSGASPPASADSAVGLHMSKATTRRVHDEYSSSWAAGSADSSRDEEMADIMSLDGSDSDASDMDLENDQDDETDVDDGPELGPEAFRQRPRNTRPVYRDYNQLSLTSSARYRSASAQATSLSRAGRNTPSIAPCSFTASRDPLGNVHASSGVLAAANPNAEREAIEALIAMGSM